MSSNETQNTALTPGTIESPDAVQGQKTASAAGTPAAVDAGNAGAASAQAGKKVQPETPHEKSNVKTAISDEVIIEFDHVTKTYNLYKNDRARFLDIFGMCPDSLSLGSVNANNNLSFKIRRGEAVAFLGSNGAGKSTCLKMITGVTYPTSGEIHVNGRVSALLELKAGFDKNLTGRENIHLRGQVMGLTEEEIEKIEPEVVKFAALGVYIDQPYRTYSSGMKSRLGFAFAVSVDPEILIIDEALSVGDRKFKRKCIKRIRKIMTDENVTVLFVTHSTGAAREFCSRGIVLDHGSKVFDGDIDEAIALYDEMNK
ncbi:MAG: ABC transporter ATP-binding protein [Eggerthellaceae bacterium]|jgi:teichoic acid transport system ATP-binding protein